MTDRRLLLSFSVLLLILAVTAVRPGHAQQAPFNQGGFVPAAHTVDADAQNVIHVDQSASGANDGTSWSDAYVHLQDALDEVNANPETEYEIRVAEGAYHPDQDSDGDHTAGDEDDPFGIDRDGVTLLGGYPPAEGRATLRLMPRSLVATSTTMTSRIATASRKTLQTSTEATVFTCSACTNNSPSLA